MSWPPHSMPNTDPQREGGWGGRRGEGENDKLEIVVVHMCITDTQEAQSGGLSELQGQPEQHSGPLPWTNKVKILTQGGGTHLQLQLLRRRKQEDHLSPWVWSQPGYHSETPLQKKKKRKHQSKRATARCVCGRGGGAENTPYSSLSYWLLKETSTH